MADLITSRDNDTIKYACKLASSKALRQSENCFFAEGLRLCLELAKTLEIVKVFYTNEALTQNQSILSLGGKHYEIAYHVAEKLAQTRSTQGVFAIFKMNTCPLTSIKQKGRYVVLENVQDPSNTGAILRSAAAFGFDGAILVGNCADVFADKALRASMGAAGRVQILYGDNIGEVINFLKDKCIDTYAAALEGSKSFETVEQSEDKGAALLIGNEGNGLTKSAIENASCAVRIPMTDKVESLNAAVAASVLLWYFRGDDLR